MAYTENVDGVSERRKFRVRWYGEQVKEIHSPKLEIKIKSNQLGRKESFPVDEFSLDDFKKVSAQVSSYSQLKLNFLPTLVNSYRRSYYGTTDGRFRITIDWDLRYFSLLRSTRFTRYAIWDDATVLELKYEESLDEAADPILQFIPFRQTKSSKYVTGMNLTAF